MNATHKNIHTLIGIFTVCSMITLFHVRGIIAQNKNTDQQTEQSRPLESLNPQEALNYLTPLLISGNIDGAASLLEQGNPVTRQHIIELLMEQDKTSLSSAQKLLFLVAAAHTYQQNRTAQYEIFNTIERYKETLPYTYTLINATNDAYQDIIEPLLAWVHEQGPDSFAESLLQEGLKTIIAHNKVPALEMLLNKKMTLSKKKCDIFT